MDDIVMTFGVCLTSLVIAAGFFVYALTRVAFKADERMGLQEWQQGEGGRDG